MISYAGVNLSSNAFSNGPISGNLLNWCAQNINPQDIYQTEPSWGWSPFPDQFNGPYSIPPRLKIGSLFWPVGASRWGVGQFFATEDQLSTIRGKILSGGSPTAKDLVIGDGAGEVTAPMYMLKPYPIQQIECDVGENIYLLTFVDKRFIWWNIPSEIEPQPTWGDLFDEIGSALGETFAIDSIESQYLTPSGSIISEYGHLPPLLDLAAFSVNRRVVVAFDGTVKIQSVSSAVTSQNSQLGTFGDKVSGGVFAVGSGM